VGEDAPPRSQLGLVFDPLFPTAVDLTNIAASSTGRDVLVDGLSWPSERVGIQIAELPNKVREAAFAGAERCLRAAGCELGVAGQQLVAPVIENDGNF
jgi:hypothetical protein